MTSEFAWHPKHKSNRNAFLRFRLDFQIEAGDKVSSLHVFADSRYRLWLDGKFVSNGPARFSPDKPEYDRFDIGAQLSPGSHQLAVEVQNRGEKCFQAVNAPPGLWVEGTIRHADARTTQLGTPGNWVCSPSVARSEPAPPYSFAISAVELFDARKESWEWLTAPVESLVAWEPANAIASSSWGKLLPRSIPTLSFRPTSARSTLLLAPTKTDELILSAGAHVSSLGSAPNAGRLVLAAWIHSDQPKQITFGAIGCDYALNGASLTPQPKDPGIRGLLAKKNYLNAEKDRGTRRTFALNLEPGWNLLSGIVPFLGQSWAVQVALPQGTCCRPEPDTQTPLGCKISFAPETVNAFEAAWPSTTESLPDSSWQVIGENHPQQIPSLRSAWDLPTLQSPPESDRVENLDMPLSSTGSAILLQDFERSVVGHLHLEITAPEGTIVDISLDERRNPAGTVPLYRAHPHNHMADRYICRAGRQTYEGFHPRGGRFLQINVRNASGPVHVHLLALRDRRGPLESRGNFSSSDPLLDKIWSLCHDCILESLDESWIDGWREHGVYLGDSVVQFSACSLLNFDQSAAYLRRTLQLFLSCQRSDGQMLPCVPSNFQTYHPDFTLHWGILLHDYWSRSGDLDTVAALWTGIERIHGSSYWTTDADGLWESVPPPSRQSRGAATPFIDWGVETECRWGKANLAMNALRVRFLAAASDMAQALGKSETASSFRKERDRVAAAINKKLWQSSAGRFADYLDQAGSGKLHHGAHGNVFAALADIPTSEQAGPLLEFIESRCENNRDLALQGNEFAGQMELYFCHHTLEALGRFGKASTAEKLIKDMWELHFAHDAKGCWEALCRGPVWGIGSICHSWSTAPLIYASRYILGVQWDFAREPGVVHVRPTPGSLEHARGSVSLPGDACLHVAWKRQPNGELEIETELHGADYQIVVLDPKPSQSVSV